MDKLTALDAYQENKLHLPPGYGIEHGADALLLRREDDSLVAALTVKGATPSEVRRIAWDDHVENGRSSA